MSEKIPYLILPRLQKVLEQLSGMDADALQYNEINGGRSSFDNLKGQIQYISQLAKKYLEHNDFWEGIPICGTKLEMGTQPNISEVFEDIKQSLLSTGSVLYTGGILLESGKNHDSNYYQTLFESIQNKCSHIQHDHGLKEKWEAYESRKPVATAELKEALEYTENLKKQIPKLKSKLKQLESIKNETEDELSREGANEYARHFETEAENNQFAAESWLFTSIFMAIATFIIAVGPLSFFIYKEGVKNLPWQLLIINTSTLPVPFLLLLQCLKDYNANRHLSTINQHKAISLKTLPTLREATSNEKSKEKILLKTNEMALSPPDTGYRKQKNKGNIGTNISLLSTKSPDGS